MHVEECVCACVHIYACMYVYNVLVEIWEGGGRREGVKAGDKHEEGASTTSLASDRIRWDSYVYKQHI